MLTGTRWSKLIAGAGDVSLHPLFAEICAAHGLTERVPVKEPDMSKLAHSHPDGLLIPCSRCEGLEFEDMMDAEATDLCDGEPICTTCAPEVIEENGQFGVGA